MTIDLKISQVEKRSFQGKDGKTINYLLLGGTTKEGDRVEVSTSASGAIPAEGSSVAVLVRDCKRLMLGVYKVRGSLK